MQVNVITASGVEQFGADELPALLKEQDGLIWVDIPSCDAAAASVLTEVFGFHPMAVKDCVERNRVPKVHVYSDHVFVVLHAPERGRRGHVHYIEALTSDVWQLEQQVTGGDINDPQEFVKDMFQARHGLLTVRTMGTLSARDLRPDRHPRPALRRSPPPDHRRHRPVRPCQANGRRRARVPAGRHRVLPDHADPQRHARRTGAEPGGPQPDARQLQTERRRSRRSPAARHILRSQPDRHHLRMNFDHMPELHWALGYPFALVFMVLASAALYLLFKRLGWL